MVDMVKTDAGVFANFNIFKVRIVFLLPRFLEPFECRQLAGLEPVIVLTSANTAQLRATSIPLPVEYHKEQRDIETLLGEICIIL